MTQNKKKLKLQGAINKVKTELARLRKVESGLQARWRKGYERFVAAAERISGLKNVRTKEAARLRKIVQGWNGNALTIETERSAVQAKADEKDRELQQLIKRSEELATEMQGLTRETDGVVEKVFELNAEMVVALHKRDAYLSEYVYRRLLAPDGEEKSRTTFDSSDGLRRVVARKNYSMKVDAELANQAQAEIDAFFRKFTEQPEMDAKVRALYELTKAVLVPSKKFKAGPGLDKFMSIEIDEGVFPELYRAQLLLRGALRGEKTSPYVRLYERAHRKDKWKPVGLQ